MVEAVIYDVDGTLIDSEPLHMTSWDRALRKYGQSLAAMPEVFRASMAGRKPIAIATDMTTQLPIAVTPEKLLETKAAILLTLVKTQVVPMPGAIDSIKRFKKAGLLLGIGAALDRSYVDLVLQALQVEGDFDEIVTGDIVKQGKPHPETYLTAAAKLRLQPAKCVVFEDAKSGVAAAKAAGCRCIAITNPRAREQDVSQADMVVISWNQVTLEILEKLPYRNSAA